MAYYWFLHHLRPRTIMVARDDDTIGNSNLVAYTIVCHAGREEAKLKLNKTESNIELLSVLFETISKVHIL